MPSIWIPDAPPGSAGPVDDEFADAAGAGAPTGWTEVDHDTLITISENEEGLAITHATNAGNSVGGVYRAIAAAPFTYWTKVSLSGLGLTNTIQAGLALFEDATNANGDIATIMLRCNATAVDVCYQVWSSRTTASSTTSRVISVDVAPTHLYLRARLTSTTYAFDFSSDGIAWQRIQSGVHGLANAPTHVGLVIDNNASAADAVATFAFFRSLASDVGTTGLVGGDRITVTAA